MARLPDAIMTPAAKGARKQAEMLPKTEINSISSRFDTGEVSGPTKRVRRIVQKLGYRFGSNRIGLPGKPDLVFAARKKAIFVLGCYWYRHACAIGQRVPKSRVSFWEAKFQKNASRLAIVCERMTQLGWSYLLIWECETNSISLTEEKLKAFLDEPKIDEAGTLGDGLTVDD